MLPDAGTARAGRRFLKRFMYAQLAVLEGLLILLGKAQPRIPFTVKAEPASVYYHFRVTPERLDDFVRFANLPAEFTVCPMACLAGDAPDTLLTLNVYEVSGIASGRRAEWSTYVLDATGTPRYMVLEALSSTYSMDPVDIITPRSRVDHKTAGGRVRTTLTSPQGQRFDAQYAVPDNPEAAVITPAWAAANDYIYWRNGVCDRTFYDAAMARPSALHIPGSAARLDNRTHWAAFVDPIPVNIVHFLNPIDFVIQPWANV